ncbi:MAG: GtrA family protein [Verrucomicrobiales bacterium]
MNKPEFSPSPLTLRRQLHLVWRFALTHRWQETFAFLKSKDAPFVVQFLKYGVCGGIAFISHNGVAFWLSVTAFPAIEGLDQTALAKNQIYANIAALAVSNLVAYITNVLWVFTGGRHHRVVEFLMFTAVNVVSGLAGILLGPYLRAHLGTSWWIAQVTLIVTSALVNFVCRKFFVFHK